MFIKDDKLKEDLPVSLQRLEQDQSRANTASEQQKIFTGVQQSTLMAIVVNSTRSGSFDNFERGLFLIILTCYCQTPPPQTHFRPQDLKYLKR